MSIGTSTTRHHIDRICTGCAKPIDDKGMCSSGCRFDLQRKRPSGSVMVRTYERVDTLISEQFNG